MKKILVPLLLLVTLFTLTSCGSKNPPETNQTKKAEKFTIHNGVTFGMTEEEVFSIEEQNGFSHQSDKDYGPYVNGKIAGFDESKIYYGFNADGKLVSASYTIGEQSRISRYDTIYDGLVSKYGKPSENVIVFDNIGATNIMLYNYNLLSSFLSCTVPNLDQWIVRTEDGYVSIIAINYYANAKSEIREVWISYEFITEDNYNATIAGKDAENKQAIDDL